MSQEDICIVTSIVLLVFFFWSQCYTVNKIKRKRFISYFISISHECDGMWRARGEGRCRDRGLEIHLSFTSASFLITIILTFGLVTKTGVKHRYGPAVISLSVSAVYRLFVIFRNVIYHNKYR